MDVSTSDDDGSTTVTLSDIDSDAYINTTFDDVFMASEADEDCSPVLRRKTSRFIVFKFLLLSLVSICS